MNLGLEDVVSGKKTEHTSYLNPKFLQKWREQHNTKTHLNMWLIFMKIFYCDFLQIVFVGVLYGTLQALSILLMGDLIDKLIEYDTYGIQELFVRSSIYTVVIFLSQYFYHLQFKISTDFFMKIKKIISSQLYRKLMEMSIHSLAQISGGKLINAATSDLVILDYGQYYINLFFFTPINVPFFVYVLWSLAGVDVVWGVIFLILTALASPLLGKCASFLKRKSAALTDQRLQLLYDTIGGIRVIKSQNWENEAISQIKKIRSKQVKILRLLAIVKTLNETGNRYSAYIATAIVFLSKTIRNQAITTGSAFALLAGLIFFANNVVAVFCSGMLYFLQFLSSLKRTQNILYLPDKSQSCCSKVQSNKQDLIDFKEVVISWQHKCDKSQKKCKKSQIYPQTQQQMNSARNLVRQELLTNISFKVKQGQLIGVVGPVGCGKTSLLLSILQQNFIEGDYYIKPGLKVSYVEQEPFILSDTVLNNILFGLPFQEQKFKKATEVACLTPDFKQLAKGIYTQIGEKGINLSGGQKARISLARALYSQADLYLLDDPLSAVDPKIATFIMDECLCKELNQKTRILVTHRIQYLSRVNVVLYLDNNTIQFSGSYDQFIRRGY